ncbi:hypothetical protein MJO28_007156 [Puccinia striiformis f. sp. tritici]|uniref:Uncharacterized protein n=1 Tax=Puccinia striiformis f. sp. tritici TaxID=168172 RepID=A0ACC0EF59_9BASI|nr:hypothetical protein MJO28_007156 [Puccinia striiformis f. sp. tritici]
MLQSLSDSLKVEAQAILDNLDPAKLTKINSFFNNCLGKISNFALQKAQHNFTQTRESLPPTISTNSHTIRTGIPCKHLWKFWNLACWLSQSILILNGI